MRPQIRKVLKLGRSALAITLPKGWTSTVRLKEGDFVLLDSAENGVLRIKKADEEFSTLPVVCVVNADACNGPNMLFRTLVGAYMVGHKMIWVQSRNGFKESDLEQIKPIAEKLIGLHITEQTENIIILQSLADPSRPTIDSSLRRLHLIGSTMYERAIGILVGEEEQNQLERVRELGVEADKVYWLVTRQLLLSINNRALAKELGIRSHFWLLGNRTVVRLLKSIVNEDEEICDYLENLIKLKYQPDPETLSWFINLRERMRKISNDAIDSLIARDLLMANEAIESANRFIKMLKATELATFKKYDVNVCPSLSGIVRSLKNILFNYRYIAEIAINRSVEESGEYVTIDTGLMGEWDVKSK